MGDPKMVDRRPAKKKESLADFASRVAPSSERLQKEPVQKTSHDHRDRQIEEKKKKLAETIKRSEEANKRQTGRRMKAVQYEEVAGDDELVFSDEAVGSETEVATVSPEVAESERLEALKDLDLDASLDVVPEVSREVEELETFKDYGPPPRTPQEIYAVVKDLVPNMQLSEKGGFDDEYKYLQDELRKRKSAIPKSMEKDVRATLKSERTLRAERPSADPDAQARYMDAARKTSDRIEAKYADVGESQAEKPKKKGRIRRFLSRSKN